MRDGAVRPDAEHDRMARPLHDKRHHLRRGRKQNPEQVPILQTTPTVACHAQPSLGLLHHTGWLPPLDPF